MSFAPNKTIGIIIPKCFYEELLNSLKPHRVENTCSFTTGVFHIERLTIDKCSVTLHSYGLDGFPQSTCDEYVQCLSFSDHGYGVSIHTPNSFFMYLDYYKLSCLEKRFCCLRHVISRVLSEKEELHLTFVVNNKPCLYQYSHGKLVAKHRLVIGFDREYNIVLINGDEIVMDEHFRMDSYHKGMVISGLSRNIKGVVIEPIVSFISQFSGVGLILQFIK